MNLADRREVKDMIDSHKMTVKEVSRWLEKNPWDEKMVKEFLEKDKRKGLHSLIEKKIKQRQRQKEELIRLKGMTQYEKVLWNWGFKHVAGIDEAGRGPLAGPLVAAAVVLPPHKYVRGINDSKKLSTSSRSRLYDIIKKEAVSYSLGVVEASCIDEINIFQAGLKAMEKAVHSLEVKADYLLIDAYTIPGLFVSQAPIVKGDSISMTIACASVLAKVFRDKIMEDYDRIYPQYGFGSNKGYPTREHFKALKLYGPSPVHRRSFNLGIKEGDWS